MGTMEWRIEAPGLVITAPGGLFLEMGRTAATSEKGEIGGILYGRRLGEGLRVEACRPVPCEHVFGSAYRLSARDLAAFATTLAAPTVELQPVGWYRSEHRDMFFSSDDQALFERFFPHPWQIALIVRWTRADPAQVGLFTRDLNGRAKFRCTVPAALPESPEPEAPSLPTGPAWQILGLHHDPFPPRLDTEFVRISTQHREAVSRLYHGVKKHAGLLLLTGAAVLGRRQILESLGDLFNQQKIEFAYLPDPPAGVDEFYSMAGTDLALPTGVTARTQVLAELAALAGSATVAIVIDEAQRLPAEVLDEIVKLLTLQNRQGPCVQVVLAGEPEFDPVGEHWSIAQRIRLKPMNAAAVIEYVTGRLHRAGAPTVELIPETHLSVIALSAKGQPLQVHHQCAASLDVLAASPRRLQSILQALSEHAPEEANREAE